jgi:hypothetical protein
MRFVYPEFLWGLLTLAVPIVIHLFNFRRYKKLYFSSLKFLQHVDQETKSTQKLKHLVVLILRCLALAALVIAFANPYLPVENEKSTGGKPVIAIYLDNSFSMTAKGTEGELLSEARETARKIISNASLETRILLNTNDMSGVEQRLITKVEALEYLDKIEASPLVRQIDDVLNWQRSFIDKQNEMNQRVGTRQYILLSDFQKNSSSFTKLKTDEDGYYYPVQFIPQEKSNVYIDTAWFSSPIQRIGENNELNVRVVNSGKENLTNVELHMEVNGIVRDVFLDIPSNQKVTTTLNYTEKKAGLKRGKIEVNDKQLFWDDEYFFAYEVRNKTNILLVNSDDASPQVAQVYRLEPFYSVKTINQTGFSQDQLRNTDLVFLNGINTISSGLSDQLNEFAQTGGSIAIFPGKTCETGSLSLLLNALNLPGLGTVTQSGTRIDKLIYDDPFFAGMFEQKKENLNLPSITKAYSSNKNNGKGAYELIRLQNGMPLFLRSGGSINAFLFTSSLDVSFSNFTADALFPSLILRIGEMSQRKLPIALTIGSDGVFPLFEASDGEKPVHIKNKKLDFIPQTKTVGTMRYISLSGSEATELLVAGNYDIVDEKAIGTVALNYNRLESITSALSKDEIINGLKQSFKHVLFKEIAEGQSLASIDIEKPYEYWKVFVFLTLLFLLGEMCVLKFWK